MAHLAPGSALRILLMPRHKPAAHRAEPESDAWALSAGLIGGG